MAYVNLPPDYVPNFKGFQRAAQDGFSIKPAWPKSIDVKTLSERDTVQLLEHPPIDPQPLAFNQEFSPSDSAAPNFKQLGRTDEVCFFLAGPGLKDIALAAKNLHQENQAVA